MIDHRVVLFWVLPAFVLGIIAGVVLVVWLLFRPYATRLFRGDGAITDSGCLSCPRFRVAFERVPLSASTARIDHFSGVPREVFTFALELTRRDVDALDLENTHLSCTLTNAESIVSHSAAGALREWILQESPGDGTCAFWHPALRDLKLSTKRTYALEINVRAPVDEPAGPAVMAVPVLEGGGLETP